MTSPLTPVPALPYVLADRNESRLEVEVVDTALGDIALILTSGSVYIEPEHAPAVAAAVLAAAGSTARVIDLAGQLPEVTRDANGFGWRMDGRYLPEALSDEKALEGIRDNLALLEARAAKPAHDPGEVDAVIKVISAPNNGESWGERARDVLDALATVRGTR